jgi:hypothetical protein
LYQIIPSCPFSVAFSNGVDPSFSGRLTSASRSSINFRRESKFPLKANLWRGEASISATDEDEWSDIDDCCDDDEFISVVLSESERRTEYNLFLPNLI